jgi:hypothetical protein
MDSNERKGRIGLEESKIDALLKQIPTWTLKNGHLYKKDISIKELKENAKICHQRKYNWHFHLLTPDCKFNQKKDKHAFILENQTKDETYVTYSDKRYLKVGQSLVKLLLGDEILKNVGKTSSSHNQVVYKIIQRAKYLNKKNILWHYHILFPGCIFNKL